MATAGGTQPEWRRSSDCFSSDCVEVATSRGRILIRDSSDTGGPELMFTADQWRRFSRGLSRNPSNDGI
jgi:hypothetical protein